MPAPDVSKPNILIVDDSEMVLKFAVRVLSGLDVPIRVAINGRDALEQMARQPADIVVTDLMMPEMDGFELIRRLRSGRCFEQTQIIVMTALDQVTDKVRALGLGANDYAVKPLDASEFKARIQASIRETRLKKQLTHAVNLLDRELRLVGSLQRRLLPKVLPQGEHFATAALYEPCNQAGGDYYDCFWDDLGRLVVTVADVSGHGASAAVLMGMVRALLKVLVVQGETASEVVGRLNEALLDNIGDDPDFISLFLAFIDLEQQCINFCSAGHGDMMLVGPNKGDIHCLDAGGTVLGCFSGEWQEEIVGIRPEQSLILYTDGLIEAVGADNEEFGRSRLERLLRALDPNVTPLETVERIRKEVETFTQGSDFSDDVTLFVMKFL
jgi:phosphoserine phosphatase RsbU/P